MDRLLPPIVLAAGLALCCPQAIISAPPAGPKAVVVFNGQAYHVTVLGMRDGMLLVSDGQTDRQCPLRQIRTILFDGTEPAEASDAPPAESPQETLPPPPRIALLQIEQEDSVRAARKRLDRLGADYEVIQPDAPADRLAEFDVAYFPQGWGTCDGLAALAETYHEFAQGGGGLLFAEPDVRGDAKSAPALRLLPHPVTVRSLVAVAGGSVRTYQPGNPHELLEGVDQADLPFLNDVFSDVDPAWIVLATSQRDKSQPTLLAAEVGKGRVLLHTNRHDHLHYHFLRDRFVTRMVKWLAGRKLGDIADDAAHFGPPHVPPHIRRLERDFIELLAKESPGMQRSYRNAASFLWPDRPAQANPATRAAAFDRALLGTGCVRAEPTVPMLLLLAASDHPQASQLETELPERLRLLTGRPVEGRSVQEIAEQWWFPHREEITVRFEEMSDDQRRAIAERILQLQGQDPNLTDRRLDGTPRLDAEQLQTLMKNQRTGPGWTAWDLHPTLIPFFLNATGDPGLRWHALGPLAHLCRHGHGKIVEAAVKDWRTPNEIRVMGGLALWRGGYSVPVNLLTRMLERIDDEELKAASILALGNSKHPAAREVVLGSLEDQSATLREAAIQAVLVRPTADEAERLAEIVRKHSDDREAALPFVKALGRIRLLQASRSALAELMQETLNARPGDALLADLLKAFESASGQKFATPGLSTSEAARHAIAFWQTARIGPAAPGGKPSLIPSPDGKP